MYWQFIIRVSPDLKPGALPYGVSMQTLACVLAHTYTMWPGIAPFQLVSKHFNLVVFTHEGHVFL